MPTVSIVVSNFNYGAFLRTSIESALSQTHNPLEIIVVDDGSTDNSREVLAAYKNQIQVFELDHEGETATRNFGFSKCTGDWICFLDSDDFLHPETAARVIKFSRPEFTKIQYPLSVVDEKGKPQGLRMPRCPLDSGVVSPQLLKTGRYMTSPGSGNFYPRWFLEKIIPVPTETWPQSFDSYASTYAGFLGEIGAIQELLGFYRVHRNNMSRAATNDGIQLAQVEKLLERQFRLRRLIQQIAAERGLQPEPNIVTCHWLYLKLELARLSFQSEAPFTQMLALVKSVVASAVSAPELSVLKRIQLIMWAASSLFLPKVASQYIVRMGFDLAPENRLARMMRRL